MPRESLTISDRVASREWNLGHLALEVRVLPEAELCIEVKIHVEHFSKFLYVSLLVPRIDGRVGSCDVGHTSVTKVEDDLNGGATIDTFLTQLTH